MGGGGGRGGTRVGVKAAWGVVGCVWDGDGGEVR